MTVAGLRMLRAIAVLILTMALVVPSDAVVGRSLAAVARDPTTGRNETVAVYGRAVALVVGIDRYANLGRGDQLSYAEHDARGMAAVLRERYGFEVIELYNEAATRDGILSTLRGKIQELVGKNDALLIFFAGHGRSAGKEDNPVGFLVPHDGGFAGTALARNIGMSEIKNDLSNELEAKHILYIVDACYGGLLTRRSMPPSGNRRSLTYLRSAAKKDARQVLTAGGDNEEVLDKGPGGHSVFTASLIDVLKNADDYMTATDVAARVKEEVTDEADRRGHEQTPAFGWLNGFGDFVFVPQGTMANEPLPSATISAATDLYRQAAEYFHADQFDIAIKLFEELARVEPNSPEAPDALYSALLCATSSKKKDYPKARLLARSLGYRYPKSSLVDDALVEAARAETTEDRIAGLPLLIDAIKCHYDMEQQAIRVLFELTLDTELGTTVRRRLANEKGIHGPEIEMIIAGLLWFHEYPAKGTLPVSDTARAVARHAVAFALDLDASGVPSRDATDSAIFNFIERFRPLFLPRNEADLLKLVINKCAYDPVRAFALYRRNPMTLLGKTALFHTLEYEVSARNFSGDTRQLLTLFMESVLSQESLPIWADEAMYRLVQEYRRQKTAPSVWGRWAARLAQMTGSELRADGAYWHARSREDDGDLPGALDEFEAIDKDRNSMKDYASSRAAMIFERMTNQNFEHYRAARAKRDTTARMAEWDDAVEIELHFRRLLRRDATAPISLLALTTDRQLADVRSLFSEGRDADALWRAALIEGATGALCSLPFRIDGEYWVEYYESPSSGSLNRRTCAAAALFELAAQRGLSADSTAALAFYRTKFGAPIGSVEREKLLLDFAAGNPSSPWRDDAIYLAATNGLWGKNYARAAELFLRVANTCPPSNLTDDALYWASFAMVKGDLPPIDGFSEVQLLQSILDNFAGEDMAAHAAMQLAYWYLPGYVYISWGRVEEENDPSLGRKLCGIAHDLATAKGQMGILYEAERIMAELDAR